MIRYDVYSVKVWDSAVDNYVHIAMTKNRVVAFRLSREHDLTSRTLVKARVVHPSDKEVAVYMAAGNKFVK